MVTGEINVITNGSGGGSTPTPAPSPAPTPATKRPVTTQSIVQLPVNYGEPVWKDYGDVTIYYDTASHSVKVWDNVAKIWKISSLLSYV